KLVTAYREKALRIAWALSLHGQLPPRRAAELTGVQRAAFIMQKDYYGWFERVERGVYRLKESGTAAVVEYADVINAWLSSGQRQNQIQGGERNERSIT
ncbi:DUF2161 domain-containing phosphodiesterase, partial [Paenibacillus sepulcri]|nr:DUF2161 domain-containing phosphodiesterase [Paenibacillus sepulcri]